MNFFFKVGVKDEEDFLLTFLFSSQLDVSLTCFLMFPSIILDQYSFKYSGSCTHLCAGRELNLRQSSC